jgi:GMP synthase (glutamine-hydrolysing)
MKVLLIDNGTVLLQELKNLLPQHVFVHGWNDLEGLDSRDFDIIILSGGSRFQIVGNEGRLRDEIEIIRNCTKPLVGICYGNELIVEAYGGELEKMEVKHTGTITVDVVVPDKIFKSLSKFEVFESHEWRIQKIPKDFVVMARSSHGIEAIKHRNLPIYGLQFHPEKSLANGHGREIMMNIFDLV